MTTFGFLLWCGVPHLFGGGEVTTLRGVIEEIGLPLLIFSVVFFSLCVLGIFLSLRGLWLEEKSYGSRLKRPWPYEYEDDLDRLWELPRKEAVYRNRNKGIRKPEKQATPVGQVGDADRSDRGMKGGR